MRCNNRWTVNATGWLAITAIMIGLGGCASPPAVGPLMRVVQKALRQEQAMVQTDQQRTTAAMDQRRATLKAAFDADMNEQTALDKQWVDEQVSVYVAAREALVRHELDMQQQYQQRQQNLGDALAAQQRAIELIERQDALFASLPDARRWLGHQEKNP